MQQAENTSKRPQVEEERSTLKNVPELFLEKYEETWDEKPQNGNLTYTIRQGYAAR